MSRTTKPVFVLIPGSFCPTAFYEKVIPPLEGAGYETHAVPLVSANSEGKRIEGPATMYDDAASIKAVISQLAGNGKDVIVVMHSYAGFPGTEAVEGLAKSDRQKQGIEGGVVGLVYVAAWMPPLGKCIYELQGEPDDIKNAGEYTYFPDGETYKFVLSDLPDAEARKYAAYFENHSSACWHNVLTYPGYKFIPTTCVIPDNDLVISTAIQKGQVTRVESEGVKVTVHELKAGHVPLLSLPEQVADILINAAQVYS